MVPLRAQIHWQQGAPLSAPLNIGGFDLILCGRYSTNSETGQVGPEVVEILGISHVTGVMKSRIH
ncbi:MAG: hypothetical protein C4291_05435 [Candidatus Dadabacteria bacterium]